MINMEYFKFMSKFLIPFTHPDCNIIFFLAIIRNKILKNYNYLFLSKLCFIGVPMSLKFGVNALNLSN